jgi:hypothetical protein
VKHCPITGELLGECECGACDDIDYDATGLSDGSSEDEPGGV